MCMEKAMKNDLKNRAVICGTGNSSCALLMELLDTEVDVLGFLGKDRRWENTKLFNLPIFYDLKQIKIDGVEFYVPHDFESNDVLDELSLSGCKIRYVDNSCKKKKYITFNSDNNVRVYAHFLQDLKRVCANRKLVLVGEKEQTVWLSEILRKLNYDIFEELELEKTYKSHLTANSSVYDLFLYREDPLCIVLVMDKNDATNYTKKLLSGFGFSDASICSISGRYSANIEYTMNLVFDGNVGYMYDKAISNQKLGPYEIWGKNTDTSLKVAVLGGSTSTPGYFQFASWPELLYKKMNANGIEATVVSFADVGYTSAQELLRLERDILAFKPDVVVSFTGVNDNDIQKRENSFSLRVQKSLFNDFNNEKNYFGGLADYRRNAETWIDNVQMMKAICDLHDIRYLPILQPMIAAKDGKMTLNEKECLLNFYPYDNEHFFLSQKEFIEDVLSLIKDKPFISNALHLFDNYDVYIDAVHSNERGNSLISDYVYDLITREERG